MKNSASRQQRLLIKRVQHRVTGSVGSCAGALRGTLTKARRHAAERTLIDATVFGPRKRDTVVLELHDRRRCFLAHILDRILIAQPVRSLDGVVHMPAPVVFTHVAECGTDTALCGNRVTARRKYFGDGRGRQTEFGEAQRCTQTRTTCTYDDDVIGMIDKIVFGAHSHQAPKPTRRTE